MPELLPTGKTCALILCGGQSRRMGSDKAVLDLDGETLLERAAAFWRSVPGIETVLAAVGTEDHLPSLPQGVLPVYDQFPGCGPMAGIHAAFARTEAELLYVSAVDMPFLTPAALLPAPAGDAIVYTRDGRPEPLFGVYRRAVLQPMAEALASGCRKMADLLRALDTEYVPLPEELTGAVSNWNTRADVLRDMAGTPPVVVFMGWSGSGKTTFLEKLLGELIARGLRVNVMKHDGHGFQMDKPGKDTWRFAQAGAAAVAISGPNGWAVLSQSQIGAEDLRRKLPPADLILAEGLKSSPYPKLQVYREAVGKPFIPCDSTVLAVISDDDLPDPDIPRLGLEDVSACADLLLRTFLPERDLPGNR